MPVKTAMSLVETGSPTSKTLKKRCSSASRRISRSGLIRELNEMRANCRGWSREVLTPSVGDVDYCAIRLPSKRVFEKFTSVLKER